ncbi:MAG TPA: alpha/beta hydrolase [Solirubrobacterales bacterium]|nr:alpha/beta hydrolase [Solirubrobacterales bacterium]
MASLPRLPPRLEHPILRAACGLPPAAQRLIFGRPPAIDGQELAEDIHVILRLAALAGSRSLTADGEPARIRAERRTEAAVTAGPPIPMARVREMELPGPAGPLRARLYEPAGGGSGPRPLLVFYHGGGWVIGDLDTHDGVCRFLSTHSGALVLSVDYRLAPEHPFPAAVEDAEAAFAWSAAHAAELGADPKRIAVGGDSAGGNLATVTCILARDSAGPRPAMQLLIYPPTDADETRRSRHLFADGFLLTAADMAWFERHYLPNPADLADPRVSVLRMENLSDLPPAYLATAGFDPLRDEGEAYAQRMREAGVPVALRRHPRLVHSFANLTAVSRSARGAMLEAAGALRMGLG